MLSKGKKKSYKTSNPEWAKAQREIRRSSAASPQDNRPNRLRTRKDVIKHEIKAGEDG